MGQRHGEGQVGAGRVPGHHVRDVVHEITSPARHPVADRRGVLDRGREGLLRRPAVVDREHGPARPVDGAAAVRVVGLEIAVDEAAAVEVEQEAAWRGRRVEPARTPAASTPRTSAMRLARLDRGLGRRFCAGLRDLGPVLVGHPAPAMRPACQAGAVPRIPSSVGWLVLTLVFVDEVLACVAAGVYGAHRGGWLLATGLVVLTVAVWWTFASPKAPLGGPVVRPVAKVLSSASPQPGLGPPATPAGRSRSWSSRSSSTRSPSTPTCRGRQPQTADTSSGR